MIKMDFKNEAPIDFSLLSEQEKFSAALAQVKQEAKKGILKAEPLINGKTLSGENSINSINPSNSSEILGKVSLCSVEQAKEALTVLEKGATKFRELGFKARADLVRKAANLMRQDRFRLTALIVLEAGKSWAEADGDVCEAIDFCDYYAEIAESYHKPQHLMPELLGELNHLHYFPRGLSVVIAPWNFPLAILCGMTIAALVTGNPTVMKPAEQTSLIAAEFAKILLEAGFPKDSFAFLPGEGETVGRYLVDAPQVKLICFTGSKAVGLEILQKTSIIQNAQRHIKRAILELGGKNAIIIDSDADFDEAIKGVLYSAFGFSGQKCSACSRLIIVGKNTYQANVDRLLKAASSLIVGAAEKPETYVGPLIDDISQARVNKIIEDGAKSLNLAFKGQTALGGYFVPPAIFTDVPTDHSLWREEIFGPVLSVCQVDSFEEAIKTANDSQYALTGGVYSRSPKHLEIARNSYEAGNLYINRGITGAIVGRQPFGGFKLSGIGSKAGGPDYLLQFVEPRTITENTMRKGFTPELAS